MLGCGSAPVAEDWFVTEPVAPLYCRVYFVHSGAVTYTDDMLTCQLVPGQAYLFPSAAPYRMTQDANNRLHCTFLHLDVFPALVTRLITLKLKDDSELFHLFSAIAAAVEKNHLDTLNLLADALLTCLTERGILVQHDTLSAQALTYIAAHYAENITVQQLADQLGYQHQYFIRKFKSELSLTPYQYIIHYRLREATRLLRGTTDSVAEIAAQTGFVDSKALCRAFKQKYGVSPKRFRVGFRMMP